MNKFLFYYSNLHIGAGLLGGSYAGLETDEQGNINGFNPQNFALGFASGAGLSKGLQLSTKRLEKLASKHPRAKAILAKLESKITSKTHTRKSSHLYFLLPKIYNAKVRLKKGFFWMGIAQAKAFFVLR